MLLFGGSLYIVFNASQRFLNPRTPELLGMFWLAVLGVCVNGFAAWRVSRGSTQNEKAIAWHMMEDLFGWIAVLVSSIVMHFIHVPWLDPFLAIVIASLVLIGSGKNLWLSFRLFLQAAPIGLSEAIIRKAIEAVPGVKSVKNLQLWSLDGQQHIGSAKIVLSGDEMFRDWEITRCAIDSALAKFGKIDMTVEPIAVKSENPLC
jgi:cobalt-zinc-cadmium efflux system protein